MKEHLINQGRDSVRHQKGRPYLDKPASKKRNVKVTRTIRNNKMFMNIMHTRKLQIKRTTDLRDQQRSILHIQNNPIRIVFGFLNTYSYYV